MSGNRIGAVVEAVHHNIANFDPQTRGEIHEFFDGLPGLFEEMGKAFTTAADGMTSEHVHEGVLEMLRELASVVTGVAGTADQLFAEHSQKHHLWLND